MIFVGELPGQPLSRLGQSAVLALSNQRGWLRNDPPLRRQRPRIGSRQEKCAHRQCSWPGCCSVALRTEVRPRPPNTTQRLPIGVLPTGPSRRMPHPAEDGGCTHCCPADISRQGVPLFIPPCGGRSKVGSVIEPAVLLRKASHSSRLIGNPAGIDSSMPSTITRTGLFASWSASGTLTFRTPSAPTRDVNTTRVMEHPPLRSL